MINNQLSSTLRFTSLAAKTLFVSAACFSAASYAETCPAFNEITQLSDDQHTIFRTASGWAGLASGNSVLQDSFLSARVHQSLTNLNTAAACDYNILSNGVPGTMAMTKFPDTHLTADTSVTNKWRQPTDAEKVTGLIYVCDNSSGTLTQADCPLKPASQPVSNSSANPFGKK